MQFGFSLATNSPSTVATGIVFPPQKRRCAPHAVYVFMNLYYLFCLIWGSRQTVDGIFVASENRQERNLSDSLDSKDARARGPLPSLSSPQTTPTGIPRLALP